MWYYLQKSETKGVRKLKKCIYLVLLITINLFAAVDKQELCDKFYAIDNELTITIDIATNIWNQLRNDNPDKLNGESYTEFTARSISITGTEFPASTISYSNPKLRGKGTSSHNGNKPSMKIKIIQENAVENMIGIHNLVLNNSHQDPSYINQIVQNKLCQYAKLPYQRCNFSKVIVKDGSTVLMNEVYVNIEKIGKRFIKNNFSCDPDLANLYEFEGTDWDNPNPWPQGTRFFEGWSNYPNVDLNAAANYLMYGGISDYKVRLVAPNYYKFWAMEILLKHWDGNSNNMNNTYIYNNAIAVQNPSYQNPPVSLNFIMSGTDQIFEGEMGIYNYSFLASKLAANVHCLGSLKTEMRWLLDDIFCPEFFNEAMLPFIEKCRTVLHHMGVPQNFTGVINQLKLAYSEGYSLIGETPPQNMNSTEWFEDDILPAGAQWAGESEQIEWVTYGEKKYSGKKSHQTNNVAGAHQHYFSGASNNSVLKILNGEELYTHVFLDPTNPPQEVMIQWFNGFWRRAYWGENKLQWGAKTYMGPLPSKGTWVKLSVPSSIVGKNPIGGFAYSLYGGKATWDATGVKKMYPWVDDDELPEGAYWYGDISWVTNPVFSGNKARKTTNQAGLHWHSIHGAWMRPMEVINNDDIYTYIFLDPTSPPQEIVVGLCIDNRPSMNCFYWGQNIVDCNPKSYVGPIPESGKWVKLIIPGKVFNGSGSVVAMHFGIYGGKATWDAIGVDYSKSILNW